MTATCWVVAGAPGAGKSTIAERLAPLLSPVPAILDKDTLFRGLAGEVLAAHARDHGEREGGWYDRHVKRHEYAAMTAAARQIRAAGCPVMLVAPFTSQIRDTGRWASWLGELGGDPVRLVWVTVDATTLRQRMLARGRPEDAGKLADFHAFAARMRLAEPPPVPHQVVDSSRDVAPALRRLQKGNPAWSAPPEVR